MSNTLIILTITYPNFLWFRKKKENQHYAYREI